MLWTSATGPVFRGSFSHNMPHGLGTLEGNGTSLRGNWVDGKAEGVLVFTDKDGKTSQSVWLDGVEIKKICDVSAATGGAQHSAELSGDKCANGLFNGARDGRGSLEYENGDHYRGDLKDDKRHGRGVMIWHNGDTYDWLDQITGCGKFTFKSSSTPCMN